MRRCELARICGAVLLGCLLPAIASAQSTIAGQVTDATGGVLPGVTVEASSPALIERVRSVASDAEGRYAIVDVRPGTYTITFTLTGFTSVRREGVQVESNATVPINAELRVGAVEETITVSGETPVVDIQTIARRETINREQAEVLPTTRNAAHMMQLIPGVRPVLTNGRAGLQGATENVFLTGRGLGQYETRWNVDGMDSRTGNLDGLANLRLNDAMVEETTFTTSSQGIESPTGGVSLNMIPRDGGNRFSGSFVGLGNPSSWVGDNTREEWKALDLDPTSLGTNTDGSVAVGGPIKRDRLWFYSSIRRQSTNQLQADEYDFDPVNRNDSNWFVLDPLPTWHQLEEKTTNVNASGRLTAHLSQGQKLTAYYDRTFNKDFFSDPALYTWQPWTSADFLAQAKYTNTVSSRLLFDAGWSGVSYKHIKTRPPIYAAEKYTPKWYATAPKNDLTTGRSLYGAYTAASDNRWAFRNTLQSTVNYITGSHSAKGGVQIGNAYSHRHDDFNGNLIARYRNGVADSVLAYNHPAWSHGIVNLDLGLYAGDTWTLKRLTVNGGIRYDHWDGGIEEYTTPAGRFVKERFQPEYHIPVQNNISARVGATYDLFGGARTALKFGFGKYIANLGVRAGEAVNAQNQATQALTWNDADRNGVATDNELENIQTVNPNFYNGIIASRYDPGFEREYNYERMLGIQHQLKPGLAVNAMYYHRQRYNIQVSDRTAVSLKDYFPYNVVTPALPAQEEGALAPGSVVTIYNLPNELRSVYAGSPIVIRTEKNSDVNRFVYDGLEFSFDGRIPGGGRAQGGWTLEKNINVACASTSNPNTLRFCDESQLGLPFRHEFKLAGTQPIHGLVDVSVALQSVAGLARPITWAVSRTIRYAANCPGACRPGDFVVNGPQLNGPAVTLAIAPPGNTFFDRYTDLTLGISRQINVGRSRLRVALDVFNALNDSAVITSTNEVSSTNYGVPSVTHEPRVFRVQARYSF